MSAKKTRIPSLRLFPQQHNKFCSLAQNSVHSGKLWSLHMVIASTNYWHYEPLEMEASNEQTLFIRPMYEYLISTITD